MPNIWIIFLTGLTTGGLSCLAVQGGLLANVIAQQAEKDTAPPDEKEPPAGLTKKQMYDYLKHQAAAGQIPAKVFNKHLPISIGLFLASKIFIYTILGFLLGWLGTMLQLNSITRAILMLAIGIFMIGTALRMLDVHPIFRYFQIQPPRFITKFIRRFAKNSSNDFATPTFLGLLTVLIPCGVTQAMMALAIGSGKPILGAVIMFSFTLGTTPVFFTLAYLATRLGEIFQSKFLKVAAIAIIILGLFSIESGLNLVGSPVSFLALKGSLASKPAKVAEVIQTQPTSTVTLAPGISPTVTKENSATSQVTINISNNGYDPNLIEAKANQPLKLTLKTKNVTSCSRAFVIPSLDIEKLVAQTGSETIDIPPQKSGTLNFSCSMGMYRGQIRFN